MILQTTINSLEHAFNSFLPAPADHWESADYSKGLGEKQDFQKTKMNRSLLEEFKDLQICQKLSILRT